MASIVLIFILFAVIHSITASQKFKQACHERFGDIFMRVYYRALYSLISTVTFAVVLYLASRVPDRVLWTAPFWLKGIMHGIQFGGLVFGARAFEHMDASEFLGLKQAGRYFSRHEVSGNSEGLTEGELITTGVYGVVRHPLYLAGLVIVVFNPILTMNGITFTSLAVCYFLFGVFIEERRFLKIFGQQYRDYMKKVPRLIPRMSFFRRPGSSRDHR